MYNTRIRLLEGCETRRESRISQGLDPFEAVKHGANHVVTGQCQVHGIVGIVVVSINNLVVLVVVLVIIAMLR